MDVRDLFNFVIEALPGQPPESDDWHGFWANKYDREIMCETETQAETLADFFEDLGYDIVHTRYYYHDDENVVNPDCYGWWSVYPD